MRCFRKGLSLVLALCLVLVMLPGQVFAANADEKTQEQNSVTQTGVGDFNHYPTIQIQEVQRTEQELPAEPDGAIITVPKHNAPAYLTVEQAAVKLCEYMKARQNTFDLYVSYNSTDYKELSTVLLNQAVVHTGNPTEGDYLLWHLASWGGNVEWEPGNQEWLFHFQVEMEYYTTAAQEAEMDAAVATLLNNLGVRNKSDYEKVKTVYDFICQNITYDYATLEDNAYLLKYTAYAALIDRTAVCQGYASLLYRLMLELGLDCRVIVGEVLTGDPHAWNIVKLGNVYYNLDATMDAETEPDVFFLRNSVMNYTHYRALEYCTTQFHMDYPMSETDYVEGVEGEPEYVYIWGMCGDDAYWGIDRDGKLTIEGTGATYDYMRTYLLEKLAPWTLWNESIEVVIVEEGITKLGENLFYTAERGASRILHVELTYSLISIEFGCFYQCDKLQTVTFGNSLEKIEKEAFARCESLQEVHFPESLKTVEKEAFVSCNALTSVTVPANILDINQSLFANCCNLEEVYIYSTTIGDYAFSNCPKLHKVVLSEELTWIGPGAFDSCVSLQEIKIPPNVTHMGRQVFDNCTALTAVYFEGDVPQFDYRVFRNVETTVYYPACNPTWTEDVRQNYEGTITWVPYECHDYEPVVTPATCTAGGYTTYICVHCGANYVADETPAVPHTWAEGPCEEPRTCIVCGEVSGKYHGHIYDSNVDGSCSFCDIPRQDVEYREVAHMFRMYNPNTGEHFYTGSEEERDTLVAAGWNYEGIAFTFPKNTGAPVHRLFQPSTGEHLYTMDEAEKDRLIAQGWNYEGVAFNSAYDTEAVQHRLHNPNADVGAYHFTYSLEEKQMLIDAGWEYQGIGWYSCWK